MSIGTLKIDGKKFRIIAEDEYKVLRAVAKWREREARQDAADLAEGKRRLSDPKRKTISLAGLKAELGL